MTNQAPEYPLGFGVALGFIWLCLLTSCVFALYLMRENRLRDQGKRDHRYEEPEEERNNMGDDCKLWLVFHSLALALAKWKVRVWC